MRSARVDWGASAPLRHFPLSQPPASGLQGITPMPWRRQVGSTSASTARASRLYGGCSQTKRSSPRSRAAHCASTICEAGKVEEPM
jgi:hypothetical protein